jgi:hypothetical protein
MALPGISTNINDGGLRVNRTLSGTRVLLLGTTTSTVPPLNEPVAVTNVTEAMASVRNTGGSESELSLALADAINGGAQFVEIVKIETANGLDYSGYSTQSRFIALSGAYAALEAYPTDIVVPVGAYAEDTVGNAWNSGCWTGGSYASENFAEQLAQFCYQQTKNYNSTVGIIGVKPPLLAPVTGSQATGVTFNSGGDTGFRFGTPTAANVTAWASYLNGTAYTTKVSSGWLNYLSGSTSNYASAYFPTFQAEDSSGIKQVDQLGNKVDAGAYISVVAAPLRTLGANVSKFANENGASRSNISFNTDGAAAYAGLISSLSPHRGSTNKSVPGLIPSKILSNTQAEDLMDNRMVTMIQRIRGFVVVKGVTGAYYVDRYTKSDYTQLTTVRITHQAIDTVRLAAEPYIGEASNAASLNAMRESIESGLRSMQLAGALQRYDFAVLASPDQQVLGEATVDLTLVPAFELTNVTVNVRLAKE